MTETITVAICTRDRPAMLKRCLASLQPQIDAQTELLVVESAASGAEVSQIATQAGAHHVATSRPGLDVARNLALRVACGGIIVFIDDDALAAPGWIVALRDSFAERSTVCVTGRVLPLELRTPAQRHFEERFSFDRGAETIRFTATDHRPHYPIHPYHLGTGCNMAFRRQIFDLIGPFDEALDAGTPTGGGGDLDVFRRLLSAGCTAVYNPDALVWHQHRESRANSFRQFWNYGQSLTALLAKGLLVERGLSRETWSRAGHLPREWLRQLARWLLRRDTIPLGLILVEILGTLVGPLAYLRSLRRVQRQWPNHVGPAQVVCLELSSGLPKTVKVAKNHDLFVLFRQNDVPRGSVLIQNPGLEVDRERLAAVVPPPQPSEPAQPPPNSTLGLRVSVVFCLPDQPQLLRISLEALRQAEDVPHEIIILEKDLDPETAQLAADLGARIFHTAEPNLNRARNWGFMEAGGDIVAFASSGIVVGVPWIRALTAGFGDPSVVCVCGPVLPLELNGAAQRLSESLAEKARTFERRYYKGALPSRFLHDGGLLANIAFRRDVLLRHRSFGGAFEQGTAPHVCGGLDMVYQLLRENGTVLYEPAMLAWRRDPSSLTDVRKLQFRRGVGTAATLTKWAMHGDLAAVRLGWGLFIQHVREMAASLIGLHPLPSAFALAGLWGVVLGPLVYARGLWQTRNRGPE